MTNKTGWILLALAIVAAAAITFASRNNASDVATGIKIPALSPVAQTGVKAFNNNCASCHGKNATGTKNGPPLVHIIYEQGHHSDGSFYRAVRNGVQAHHWKFGNMPPLPDVQEETVSSIITYVRELQRANGIN